MGDLVEGIRKLNELNFNPDYANGREGQVESLRRMVMSLDKDIRVVLVRLAYRTQRLYKLIAEQSPHSERVARETLDIFAPIANRLGLGQIKWELEDSAFRILDPVTYRRIAKSLEENRAARESYIADFVATLEARLAENHLEGVSVFGRPKHIYSIWRKMTRKRLSFSELFDVRAVRVLVNDQRQCYTALGIAHQEWQPITREFDDYIAKPKDNGYRSLHTAVIGPGGKAVEIQIRTREMDDNAERGVAAHWAYKEGAPSNTRVQEGINQLQLMLDESDDRDLLEGFTEQVDAERVYVFTPKGEVVDLAGGATPLDFAYQIHTEIGHRCRGARVNGRIVPLTTVLENGDRVEVLTAKEAAPSRDWLNRSLGYLHGSRARSKVRTWFKTRDHEQHVLDGKALLERELKRLRAPDVTAEELMARLRVNSVDELHARLGRNDISAAQLAATVGRIVEASSAVPDKLPEKPVRREAPSKGIAIRGVDKLLSHIAACCQPVPPEPIVGFITRGRGVTVHRRDCGNMANLPEHERERLIDVDWGVDGAETYPVQIRVEAYDRVGLVRDVSAALAALDVTLDAINTQTDRPEMIATMEIGFKVSSTQELARIMDRIRSLPQVDLVERVV
ncbi:MAG: GTP diphosphokinase [Gammaproteobacteria bacterium]|nr:MAG: GTP diphosphokinase [Gammaproteobacteria bacterium]